MKLYLKSLKMIIQYASGYFVLVVFLSVLIGLLQGVGVRANIMLLTAIQGAILGNVNISDVVVPFILITLINPSYYLYTPFDEYFRSKIMQKIRIGLTNCLFDKSVRVDITAFEDPDMYDCIYKAQDAINGDEFLNIINSIIYLPLFISSISSTILAIGLSYPPLILIPVFGMIPFFLSRYLRGKAFFQIKSAQTRNVRILDYLWSILCSRNTNRDMRVFGSYGYIKDKHDKYLKTVTDEDWNFEKKQFVISNILDSIKPVSYGIGLIFGGYLMVTGKISLPVFLNIPGVFMSIQESTEELINTFTKTISNLPFIKNLFNFLEFKNSSDGIDEFIGFNNAIEFRNISFKYPSSEHEVIKNVSFTIQKNERISILGDNGAGKSTLVKMLLGLYKPTKGEILIDGVNINQYTKKSLWNRMSAVFQNYVRYYMTVRENIGFGNICGIENHDQIQKHITKSDLSFVNALQDRMNTALGAQFGGIDLSGGQWQKIAISRGNFKDSDIIVLDEPTASLDPIVEAEVFNDFVNMAQNKTAIIISHRVGSARIAERIIVMKSGEILEDGTHNSLMALNGEYSILFKMQSAWYVK